MKGRAGAAWLVLGLVGLGAGYGLAKRRAPDAAPAAVAVPDSGSPAGPHGDPPASRAASAAEPAAWERRLPPGTRVPVRIPRGLRSGIRCPDGSFLPLLNGVPHAPPISRSAHAVTLTPVVELVVDATGCQWFVHADGSATTSRWVETTDARGRKDRQVVTDHNEVVPGDRGLLEDGQPATGSRR